MKTKNNKKNVAKRAVVTKQKRSAKTSAPLGRRPLELPIPMNGKTFSVASVHAQTNKRANPVSRVCIQIRVNKLAAQRKIKLVGVRKPQGAGRPLQLWAAILRGVKRAGNAVKRAVEIQTPTAALAA